MPTRFGCLPSLARRARLAPLAILPLLLAACEDGALPVAPVADPALAAAVAPGTLRTAQGDLITGDAAAFAQSLKEIGPDGKVLVWLKETSTPRPSADFLLNLPGSAPETIALPDDAPNAKRRNTLESAPVRGAAINAVVRALQNSGVAEVERMEALPLLIVRLSEPSRLGALNALLRHPNVDYVSAVRSRPVELRAVPAGANPMDAKHTVHKIPQAWDLTRGTGARIGVLDSGFAREVYSNAFHEDGQYFGSHGIVPLGFVDDGCSTSTANNGNCTPNDDQFASNGSAHGTAMAGLVGANDNNTGYVGIAPLATTYSMKIAWNTHIHGNCGGWFNDSPYCIEDDDFVRAVNYAATRRFHVLSMSFNGGFGSDVYRALATARNSYGVFLVAATGNTVGGSPQEPASFDVVMGIAGVDAAGNNLWSTAARDVSGYAGGATLSAACYRNYYCDAGSPGYLTEAAGTSAATANVAGIVGLIRSYHPNETPAQIWERMVYTAEGPNRVVNAYAAITYQRPLAVSIWGPTNTYSGNYETWTAMGSGGTPPYTYNWYRDGAYVGSGSTYSDYVYDGSFQLQVNVTDAVGGAASSWIWVTGGQQTCGDYLC